MIPVAEFTRVFYHGSKDNYHGRATVILRIPDPYPYWPEQDGSSTDGHRYVIKTPKGHLSDVRRQSFHTLREVSNA